LLTSENEFSENRAGADHAMQAPFPYICYSKLNTYVYLIIVVLICVGYISR